MAQSHSTMTLLNRQSSEKEYYTKLAEFPFDSTRKCMSVIVRDMKTNFITLYTKGADNVMLQKIKSYPDEQTDKEKVI